MAKTRRKIRRHDQLPAGWQFNEGRPRWIPSPTLRKAGWRGCDLKTPEGRAFLDRGASITRAEAIVAAVALWRAGQLVPFDFVDIAPKGACLAAATPKSKADRLSIGALIDAYLESAQFAKRTKSTQSDYRSKLKRLVDTLAGWVEPPHPKTGKPKDLKAYRAAVEQVRATSVLGLAPVETANGIEAPLRIAYGDLLEKKGKPMASGVMAVAGLWLEWVRKYQTTKVRNWVSDVERETPDGRLRPLTWDELAALIWAADQLGLPSIGDGVVLGVDLSWSQVDRLKLTWPQIRDGRAHTARQKTGRVGGTPFLRTLGLARIEKIRERQAKLDYQPTHVLWCERTGAPWNANSYRHAFAEVRQLAATRCASVLDATDQDLRDTAVTAAYDAGLDEPEIASRTLHKLQTIRAILDKHYGQIGATVADRGRDKLDAYLTQKGIAL